MRMADPATGRLEIRPGFLATKEGRRSESVRENRRGFRTALPSAPYRGHCVEALVVSPVTVRAPAGACLVSCIVMEPACQVSG